MNALQLAGGSPAPLETFIAHRDSVVFNAEIIGEITSASVAIASGVLKDLVKLSKFIEDSRKSLKEEPLRLTREIDKVAAEIAAPVEAQVKRLRAAISDWELSERRRIESEQREAQRKADEERREQERKQAEELRVAREKAAAESKVTEEQKRAQIAEIERQQAAERQKAERERQAQLAAVVRQPEVSHSTRTDVDFDLVNALALANAHPQLVEITPKRKEIIAALKAGIDVVGVKRKDVVRVVTGGRL